MQKILLNGKHYRLITEYKSGWNEEVFRKRYSDILDKYDYIVAIGDMVS